MLRNAVVHIANEQPILVDLLVEPTPSDTSLLCRNMRTMSGKKPVFVDQSDSTFVLPVAGIRFIEIPRAAYLEHDAERATEPPPTRRLEPQGRPTLVGGDAPATAAALPTDQDAAPVTEDSAGRSPSEGYTDLGRLASDGLDGDLLRRIRDA